MSKIILLILALVGLYGIAQDNNNALPQVFLSAYGADRNDRALEEAFNKKQSNLQVQGKGSVVKLLTDDLTGSRHQRFILKLGNDQTLLVSHNIDLAPRINNLAAGDMVEFYGEYEWNAKGGVIHWTHDDPHNRHLAGWLKHKGKIYQ